MENKQALRHDPNALADKLNEAAAAPDAVSDVIPNIAPGSPLARVVEQANSSPRSCRSRASAKVGPRRGTVSKTVDERVKNRWTVLATVAAKGGREPNGQMA